MPAVLNTQSRVADTLGQKKVLKIRIRAGVSNVLKMNDLICSFIANKINTKIFTYTGSGHCLRLRASSG